MPENTQRMRPLVVNYNYYYIYYNYYYITITVNYNYYNYNICSSQNYLAMGTELPHA